MFAKPLRIVGAVALLALAALSTPAGAEMLVLPGPDLSENASMWFDSGLEIRTKQDITLVSVLFHNQGQGDTVSLSYLYMNSIERWLCSVSTPEGDTACPVQFNYPIPGGTTFYIRAAAGYNGKFAECDDSTVRQNDHLIVDGMVGNGMPANPDYWMSFTDITTTPEPTSLGLLAFGALAMLKRKRKR